MSDFESQDGGVHGFDSDDEMEVEAGTVVILNAEEEKRLWVREWLLLSSTLGAYATLVQELSRHLLYKKARDWLKGDSLAQKNIKKIGTISITASRVLEG